MVPVTSVVFEVLVHHYDEEFSVTVAAPFVDTEFFVDEGEEFAAVGDCFAGVFGGGLSRELD